jgi:hypothetical protein
MLTSTPTSSKWHFPSDLPGIVWTIRHLCHQCFILRLSSSLTCNDLNNNLSTTAPHFACVMTDETTIKKVKQSCKTPGVAQRVPRDLGSQISMTFSHEGGEVVSLTRRPPLPPWNVHGTHFHWRPSRLQDHGTVGKNSTDTTGNRSRDRPTSSAAP